MARSFRSDLLKEERDRFHNEKVVIIEPCCPNEEGRLVTSYFKTGIHQEGSVTIAGWERFPRLEKRARSTVCTWGISLRMAPTCGLLISRSPSTGSYCIVTEKKLHEIQMF